MMTASLKLFLFVFATLTFAFLHESSAAVTCVQRCEVASDGCCEYDEAGECLRAGCNECNCETSTYTCSSQEFQKRKRQESVQCETTFPARNCSECLNIGNLRIMEERKRKRQDSSAAPTTANPLLRPNVTDFESRVCPDGRNCLLDFEVLAADARLTNYFGLAWPESEVGGYNDKKGYWSTAKGENLLPNATKTPEYLPRNYPHSGKRNVINNWGSTLMGISFPYTVDLVEAWFAVQGSKRNWAPGVRVIGYLNNVTVAESDYIQISDVPVRMDLFGAGLVGVNKLVIESIPVPRYYAESGDYGWYGVDSILYMRR